MSAPITPRQATILGLLKEHGALKPGKLALLLWPDVERGPKSRRYSLYGTAGAQLERLRRQCLVEWTASAGCRLTTHGKEVLAAWRAQEAERARRAAAAKRERRRTPLFEEDPE